MIIVWINTGDVNNKNEVVGLVCPVFKCKCKTVEKLCM